MTTVRHILERKGPLVYAVTPDAMVIDALRLMAEKDIGWVMVMTGDKVDGIFTERQYARNVRLKGRSSPETPVRDVMEPNVIYVTPEQTTEACMALMAEKGIRHLPVMDHGRLVGMISFGDLMKAIIDEHKFDIDQLVQYVSR